MSDTSKPSAVLANIRVRVEPAIDRRALGAINDWNLADPDSFGWLVLAAEGEHVLEIAMLRDEWAHKAAARFDAAASELPTTRRTAHAVLLNHIVLGQRSKSGGREEP